MKDRKIFDEIKSLSPGDLVKIEWCDASVGKSLVCGRKVDVPVSSWGIYIGVLGEKNRHVIIAQNNFRYADGLYDLDYTAIPLHWSVHITVLAKNHVQPVEAKEMINSFLMGGRRSFSCRTKQQKVRNHHDRLD